MCSEFFNYFFFYDCFLNVIEQRIFDVFNVVVMDICLLVENEDLVWYILDFKVKIEEMFVEKDFKK